MKVASLMLIFCAVLATCFLNVESNKQDNFLDASTASDSSFDSSESLSSETFDKSSVTERDVDDSNEDKTKFSNSWTSCPKGMFLLSRKCFPCSECGPDFYVRNACSLRRDTECDWCLNPSPVKTKSFQLKCSEIIGLQSEFNNLLEKRKISVEPVTEYLPEETTKVFIERKSDLSTTESVKSYINSHIIPFNTMYRLIIQIKELLLNFCLYLSAILLMFMLVRFVYKRKPLYKTVIVNPPVFDDHDKTSIIRAADEIRDKLGKKGYERLEEFI